VLMENTLDFTIRLKDGSSTKRSVSVKRIFLARHCDRDIEATRAILDAKRAEGYSAHGNPSICRKSRYLVTNEDVVEVQGPQTSGEVEIAAIMDRNEVLISAGSDHCDRTLETMWTAALGKIYDTAKIKQMAPAVVAREAWKYDDVLDHWDQLILRSSITVDGRRIPYQEFKLAELVSLDHHLTNHPELGEDGSILFAGSGNILSTVPSNVYQGQPSIQGLVFPSDFNFELEDQVLRRKIVHSYTVLSIEKPRSISL